jgi:hypothetical protein
MPHHQSVQQGQHHQVVQQGQHHQPVQQCVNIIESWS